MSPVSCYITHPAFNGPRQGKHEEDPNFSVQHRIFEDLAASQAPVFEKLLGLKFDASTGEPEQESGDKGMVIEEDEEEEGEITSHNETKRVGSKKVRKCYCTTLDFLTCEDLDQSKK
ncbi:hypothetical protein M378DRAFT_19302 [Amanita muscaria Koide BX008]|uniref:Uncharacterized protein n=1 Tax=Amanita muscaria (strain Koide BX008) TaxID=946122 RepID=A0A0C2WBS6_AMAMK|nr:hypothetical protein M378DRAFT_19302 [Amanita muscaria Koide BX008]